MERILNFSFFLRKEGNPKSKLSHPPPPGAAPTHATAYIYNVSVLKQYAYNPIH